MNSLDEDILVVGLTGQTGAGKTSVCKIFSDKNFSVINADHISRLVVEKGRPCLDEISKYFGNDILNADGTLDRSKLGQIVFTDKDKLELLNSIIYPYITAEILKLIKEFSSEGRQLILLDAPTLFESHSDDFCEVIVSVIADENIRLKRIMKRDNISAEAAQNRINSQLNEEFFLKNSDYIIENNGSMNKLYESAETVADKIKKYIIIQK